MKGAAASGHPLTTEAAIEMLRTGGNAFDGVLSAGFASIVAEPTLTSLGGGGFLLVHEEEENRDTLFDFFVNTPGRGSSRKTRPEMTPVDIVFPRCTQVFYTGFSSVAVPGMLKGLLHIHDRLCTLPLKTILAPALSCLDRGVEITATQEILFGLLKPILLSSEYGRSMFTKDGHYVKAGDRIFNPLLREFLAGIAKGTTDVYQGSISEQLIEVCNNSGGTLTRQDLEAYEVTEREPLRIEYADRVVLSNPPPASGGLMLAVALHVLDEVLRRGTRRLSEESVVAMIEIMKELYDLRPESTGGLFTYPFSDPRTREYIDELARLIAKRAFTSHQGTTHVSVIDAQGNAASMTTSNGSGSGCFIPDTGIMLNNMMGEDDLHPGGFFSLPPGKRVSSMMLPTIVLKDGTVEHVIGSGGSKRIRNAILQVVLSLVNDGDLLKDAIESPRLHYEDGVVHLEPGFPGELIKALRGRYEINAWTSKDMYFGGVHGVGRGMQGWGDSRRGGSFLSV